MTSSGSGKSPLLPRRIIASLDYRARRLMRTLLVGLKRPALGRGDVLSALRSLQLLSSRAVMVHSSLGAFGYIQGGAPTAISALREWCVDRALIMPTHSYCYPREDGSSPVFDIERTPSLVGAISNAFWRQQGVRRSLHPTHAIACVGTDAETWCAGHEMCDTPCGLGTPYERLVQSDGAVLMFGATLDAYTLFHTAEDAAQVPYLYEAAPCRMKLKGRDGAVHDFVMRRQDMTVRRRFAQMAQWLEERGLLSRLPLGRGELLWIPHAAAAHESLVRALKDDPWLLVAR